MQEKKKRRFNWGSAIGWLIFILIFAGRPLLQLLQQRVGGSVALPVNLTNLIPLAFAALVVLSIAISAVRALGGANRGRADTRLPTSMPAPPPSRGPGAPLPPFGGPATPGLPPIQTLPRSSPPVQPNAPRAFTMPSGDQPKLPTPPRFEPVISPRILLFGILGLIALGLLGMLVLGLSVP